MENLEFVRTLEKLLGKEAIIVDAPCPPSEPLVTYADITKARALRDGLTFLPGILQLGPTIATRNMSGWLSGATANITRRPAITA